MIDLTKGNFTDLSYSNVESKSAVRAVQIDCETEVKLADGTVKRAPRGGVLVEFSDGAVRLLSNKDYDRLIYG